MDSGFITLHRKILDNPLWKHSGLVHLFIHLLLLATYTQDRFIWNGKEEVLERGQLITGRYSLAESLNENPNTIYKRLKLLEKLGIINIKSNTKFSLITIIKYGEYQNKKKEGNSESNNKVTTKEQQSNTLNKVNKDNKVTIPVGEAEPQNPINQIFRIFYNTINPNINYANKTDRTAAEWLINKYGLESTLKAAEYACSVQNNKYAPTITTPYQLKEKMAALAKFKTAKKGKIWKSSRSSPSLQEPKLN